MGVVPVRRSRGHGGGARPQLPSWGLSRLDAAGVMGRGLARRNVRHGGGARPETDSKTQLQLGVVLCSVGDYEKSDSVGSYHQGQLKG